MNQIHRLFDLLQALRRHRYPVTGAVLARESGVSLRTIRRDMAKLQMIGADIDAEAGIGYMLRPSFVLPPLAFTEQELHALAIGAEWVAHQTDHELASSVRNALAKIESVLVPTMREALDGSSYYIGEAAPPPTEKTFDLTQCRRAMREERKMQITWREDESDGLGAGRTANLIVWPIMVGFEGKMRSFAGWCELARTYRIFDTDRIVNAELLNERYPRARRQLVKEWLAIADEVCKAYTST